MQTVMLLCSERWEQGTFPGQEPALGGSGAAARGCGLTGTTAPIPRIPTSFLLPGISASPSCAGDAGSARPVVPHPDGRCSAAMGCNLGRAHAAMLSPPPPACGPNPNQAAGRGLPVAGTPLWARARASTRRRARDNSHRAPSAPCGSGTRQEGKSQAGHLGGLEKPHGEGGAAAASRARGSGDGIWKQGYLEAVMLGAGIFGSRGCLEEGMFGYFRACRHCPCPSPLLR